jgi:uncharacterized membrane protein YedE/YeeE
VTSVMDIGLVLGAMTAAGLAGKFAPTWRISAGSAATAVIGGLLLGYGARIAYGCNIGAYFSGIASGSVHGWVWLPAAFAGSAVMIWGRDRLSAPKDDVLQRRRGISSTSSGSGVRIGASHSSTGVG